MELYCFQQKAVNELLKTTTNTLLYSPTGSGKTVIATSFINEFIKQKPTAKILYIVNKISLIGQTYSTLEDFNIPVSIAHLTVKENLNKNIMMNIFKTKNKEEISIDRSALNYNVLLTMPETFLNHYNKINLISPDLIIMDEAHKSTSDIYQQIKNLYINAKIIGLTATPHRVNNEEGKHLTKWYSNLLNTNSITVLIEMGRLCPVDYYSFKENTHKVEVWKELTKNSKNKQTILFTSDHMTAEKIKESFVHHGITAEVINTPKDTPNQSYKKKNEILRDFRNEKTKVLITIEALAEGFDEPIAKYCFLCRTVGSEDATNPSLYVQICGRVLRTHTKKDNAVIVDFYDNVHKYGKVENIEFNWDTLSPPLRLGNKRKLTPTIYKKYNKIIINCKNNSCYHTYDIKKHSSCPVCNTNHKIEVTIDKTTSEKIGDKTIQLIKHPLGSYHLKYKNIKVGRVFISNGLWVTQFDWKSKKWVGRSTDPYISFKTAIDLAHDQ